MNIKSLFSQLKVYVFIFLIQFLSCLMNAQTWSLKNTIDSIIKSKGYDKLGAGISVCIAHNQQIEYERQIGFANIKKKIPVTRTTRFNLGSISKQYTAACIYLLEQQGKLNRNYPIQTYLPEFPKFEYLITINHLLSHTSGLPDHMEVLGLKNNFKQSRLAYSGVLQFFNKYKKLSFKPGERFSYCNTGYMLLAEIVERISGKGMNDFMQASFFQPLSMTSTLYSFKEDIGMPDGTQSYVKNNRKFKVVKHPQCSAIGATGIFSTMEDCVKWNNYLLNGHVDSTLNKVRLEMQKSFSLNDGSSVNYGGGLILKPFMGVRNIEHSGGWNAFLTQFRNLPDSGYSILIATNSNSLNPFTLNDDISNVLMKSVTTSSERKKSSCPIPLQNFTGNYIDPNNVVRKLSVSNDTLIVCNNSNPSKQIANAVFIYQDQNDLYLFIDNFKDTLCFSLDQDSKMVKNFAWSGGHYFRFKRMYTKLNHDSNQDVNQLKGRYRCADLNQNIRIRARHGRLKMSPIFFKSYRLDWLGDQVYRVKNEPIYFNFSSRSCTIGNDWISNIEFKK